jgi:tRNA G10  N-methylase Trm11
MLYIVYSMSFQSIAILGRQPALGIAELESLSDADSIQVVGNLAVKLNASAHELAFSRLGGTIKLGQILTIIPSTHWSEIESYLISKSPENALLAPEGKLTIGISVYGLNVDERRINATALSVKRAIRAVGKSVRIIPNNTAALSSAQVIHNGLTKPQSWELLLIRDGQQTILARTLKVQDIEAYTARDQARPARDARVGMLPPKLAQIILNLATADTPPSPDTAVLDPFCGTGVVLQESLLAGFAVMGTDLEPRMVDYSIRNLTWLATNRTKFGFEEAIHTAIPNFSPDNIQTIIQLGDATNFDWQPKPDFIACETYLGQAFSAEPSPDKLAKVMQDVDTIHRKFLQNVCKQTAPGFRMCIAVPAWFTRSGVRHLNVLDSLDDLGYNRIEFVHTDKTELIYHREGQFVGRELVVLVRK